MGKEMNDIMRLLNKKGLKACMASELPPIKYMKTGIPAFDYYVQIPYGKFVIAYGRTGSGKTTLAYKIGSQIQEAGGTVAILDLEHSYDEKWAKKNGLDTENTIVLYGGGSFETAADSANILMKQIESYRDKGSDISIDFLIVDSLQAAPTENEIKKIDDSFAEEATMATLAKKITLFIRKLTPLISKLGCCIFLIGQARDNFNYGGGIQLTGGNAVKHAAWTIMKMEKQDSKKNREETTLEDGTIVNTWPVKVVLEKARSKFHQKEFTVTFKAGEGFDVLQSTVDLAKTLGILTTKGPWLYYGEEKYQGEAKLKEALLDKNIFDMLVNQIKEQLDRIN